MQSTDLERRLEDLRHGDHLCLVHDTRAEQMATAVPFIRDGLAAGECCACLADDQTVEEVTAALAAAGVDVPAEQRRGALRLLTRRDAYLRSGAFDPEAMLDFLRGTVERATSDGFPGFRVTGDMTWALGPECGCDRLIEYESRLNRFFPGSKALALCQYHRQRHSPAIIHDVLRTHPLAVLGGRVCENLYYQPPELILEGNHEAGQVEWMIRQLRRRQEESAERTRLNGELKNRVEELQAVLNIVPVGVGIAHDPGCRRITHNPYMSDLLGVPVWANASLSAPPEERPRNYTICRDGRELTPDELPMQVACTGAEVRDIEVDLVRGDESRRLLCHARPLRDGQGRVRGGVGAFLDITQRRQAEEVLRRQNERLRLLSEVAADLLTAESPDALMRGVFARLAPHFGLDACLNFMVDDTGNALRMESCLGLPEETARSIGRLEFGQACCGTVALQRRPVVATFIQQSDDPKAQLAKSLGFRVCVCNPLMTADRLLGTLSFASRSRDRFDDDELEFLATVCRYVATACERLRLLRQLRETDRKKDEFLATLAHELRNPLAPIRNAAQFLRLKGPTDPDLVNARDIIQRQVRHLARLVDDLLDVSRITRGKIPLRRERLALGVVLTSAVEASRPLIETAGHELTVTLPPEPVYLDGDLTRLAQVFGNLLVNAAKYTDRGGHIALTAWREGSDVVVSIKDTGIGIPAAHLPRLFEMFSQVVSALERSQGGLGIGLALVKGLVELHGGRVEAKSEGPGKGSEFVVRLPVRVEGPKKPQPEQVGRTEAAAQGHRRRILVADDNHDAALSLAMMLSVMGHEVRTAPDGLAAIETAEAFRPDVVLLDIGMPRLNGYDTARRIREQPWGEGMTLAALTGWGQEEDRRKAREAGFDRHFTKPVDPAALQALLDSLDSPAKKQ